MRKFWLKLKTYLKPFLNLKFLVCFGLAWLITNGWSYIMLGVGIVFKIGWMISVSSSYLAFLYLPFTPEKLITIPLALLFHRWFFKNDEKTKQQLEDMKSQAREDWNNFKRKIKKEK